VRTACIGIAVAALAAACSSSSTGGSASSTPTAVTSNGASIASGTAVSGGSITVLEGKGFAGDWPAGLDPATNTDGAANQDLMTAVYGQLLELQPDGTVRKDLASDYSISADGKTVTINLRQGVKFSDGTPLDATAVVWNWKRDFASGCTCSPAWPVHRTGKVGPTGPSGPLGNDVLSTPDDHTVVVHLLTPDGAFINQMFDSTPNWIASPTAFNKAGEQKFKQFPVGAGPFTVVSDTFSTQLVAKKNPLYWDTGKPYLDQITFKSVPSDEAAYEALLAGQGQVYENMSTSQLLDQSTAHGFQVLTQLGTSPYDLQLNTSIPPFNNAKARQAIYAATNFAPILSHIFANKYPPVEGFTGPGGICYQQNVPGYQQYNPTLAKQLVQEAGLDKITFQLGTIQNQVAQETTEALQSEWQAVGIKTTLASWNLTGLIQAFTAKGGKQWTAMIQTAGAFDPAGGVGVGFRFNSTSPFSGVHDPKLDAMLTSAASSTDLPTRCKIYNQAAQYIASNWYGPFYFSFAPANVSVKGVFGPGLTQALPAVVLAPTIPWEEVWYNPPK
jgi:peptide/nickel transport system substrate-binding protein